MKKAAKIIVSILALVMCLSMTAMAAEETAEEKAGEAIEETTAAEAGNTEITEEAAPDLKDGIYIADFLTDSSMFHVNEANEDKGILTVENGEMTIHISLVSKSILNLYPGLAEDAQKEGAQLLEPTTDSVTYSDGYTEEVYGFDVPVPYLEDEFDLALIGKKGEWYDHKVKVTDVRPMGKTVEELGLEDGTYSVEVSMEGGSGKASIQSPCELKIENGNASAVIVWSSSKYDYMLVGEEKYEPVTLDPGSTFEIPVAFFDAGIDVIGDTTAMSQPHEVEYTLIFDSESIVK